MVTIANTVKASVLPNGRAGSPPEASFTVENLDKKLISKGVQSIETAFEIQAAIDIQNTKINVLVFDLVKDSVTATMQGKIANLPNAIAYFNALCKEAETQALSKYNEKHGNEATMREACPTWAVYKTGCLSALKEGISPFDRTENEALKFNDKKAAAKFVAEGRAVRAARAPQTPDTRAPDPKVISLQNVKLGMNPELAGAMSNLTMALRRLSVEGQVKATAVIMAATGDIAKLETAAPATGKATAQPA